METKEMIVKLEHLEERATAALSMAAQEEVMRTGQGATPEMRMAATRRQMQQATLMEIRTMLRVARTWEQQMATLQVRMDQLEITIPYSSAS